jgi:site-specific DNA-methyltransferase (adenine-specific)
MRVETIGSCTLEPILINDHYQNFKKYGLHKAQLIIADIPYNIEKNAYGSNPSWYVGGDNKNGESCKANTDFFGTDNNFKSAEFMHFASKMLKKEPKEKGQAPCMIVFCAFDQQMYLIDLAKRYGLNNYINLIFRKNFSAQVLKANMRVVGNAEYGLILYRDKLPLFNNNGEMIFNVLDWEKDSTKDPIFRKIHPTQKPLKLLKRLIQIFTNPGDMVIDPCAGSFSTLVAARATGRNSAGFEIDKDFFAMGKSWVVDTGKQRNIFDGIVRKKTSIQKILF